MVASVQHRVVLEEHSLISLPFRRHFTPRIVTIAGALWERPSCSIGHPRADARDAVRPENSGSRQFSIEFSSLAQGTLIGRRAEAPR